MRVYSVDKSIIPLRKKEITIAGIKISQNECQFGVLRAHYSMQMTTLYMEYIAGIYRPEILGPPQCSYPGGFLTQ